MAASDFSVAAAGGPFDALGAMKSCGGVEGHAVQYPAMPLITASPGAASPQPTGSDSAAVNRGAGVESCPQDTSRERNMVAVGLGYREMIAIALEMYAVFTAGFICGAALIGTIWAVFG